MTHHAGSWQETVCRAFPRAGRGRSRRASMYQHNQLVTESSDVVLEGAYRELQAANSSLAVLHRLRTSRRGHTLPPHPGWQPHAPFAEMQRVPCVARGIGGSSPRGRTDAAPPLPPPPVPDLHRRQPPSARAWPLLLLLMMMMMPVLGSADGLRWRRDVAVVLASTTDCLAQHDDRRRRR
jgi:hypothetical protein